MKKLLCVLLALFLAAGLFAGSLDYLTNQSATWMMITSRNAATDSADIVNFNPAGTVFLAPGLHIDVSNQTLFKFYGNDVALTPGTLGTMLGIKSIDDTFNPEKITWALPNLYVAYNFGNIGPGKLAAYLQGGVVAGGGNLNWQDGTAGTSYALNGLIAAAYGGAEAAAPGSGPATLGALGLTGGVTSQSFEASSIYYNVGLGGAYSFLDDMLSLSLGVRMVLPRRGFILEAAYGGGGKLKGEIEYNAVGFTPIIGFDARPITGLTLSARYEIETQLEFEYNEKDISGSTPLLVGAGRGLLASSGISDGKKFKQNLPHLIALGAEYAITDALAVSLSANFYLINVANMGKVYDSGAEAGDLNDYFGLGFEAGLGVSYEIIEGLKAGAGFMYNESGAKDSYFNDSKTILNASANPPLDSIAVGLGASYTLKNGLSFTLAFLYSHYLPQDYSVSTPNVFDVSGTYEKDVLNIGIGVGFHY
jgi:long-chain fatty acid transport protein